MTGYVGSIDTMTLKSIDFRQVLFSGAHAQLIVMCLQAGESIGDEVHAHVDHFFRIEQGEASFVFNAKEEHRVRERDAIVVRAGRFHNVTNTSATHPLKLYTVYAPPNYPDGTLHKTKADADAAEPTGI